MNLKMISGFIHLKRYSGLVKRYLTVPILLVFVSGCSSSSIPQDPQAQIVSFVDSINSAAACTSEGYTACMNLRLSLAYPGSMDQGEAKKCIASRPDDPNYRYDLVLAESTITRDDAWVGPAAADSPDWLFAGQKPAGDTYKADVVISENYSGQDSTVKWNTHFTIKDGRVYWFPRIC